MYARPSERSIPDGIARMSMERSPFRLDVLHGTDARAEGHNAMAEPLRPGSIRRVSAHVGKCGHATVTASRSQKLHRLRAPVSSPTNSSSVASSSALSSRGQRLLGLHHESSPRDVQAGAVRLSASYAPKRCLTRA
jgi:hypothetical protein